MSFLFDVFIIGIIVFSIYRGVSQGFVKSLMKLLSVAVALIVASIFTDTLAEFYRDSFVLNTISEKVSEVLLPLIRKTGEAFNLETLFADMPDVFGDLLYRFGGDLSSLEGAFGANSAASANIVGEMAGEIAAPIATMLSRALAFITLFVGAIIAMALLTLLLDLLVELPILRKANKLLGALFGMVVALVFAYLFSELSVVLINVGIAVKPDLFNENIIENSLLLKFFSDFSILSVL